MGVKLRDYPDFYYISYKRDGYQDLEVLKREFGNITGLSAKAKDVAVDLSASQYITSPEIGALVRLLGAVAKSDRSVMLIVSPSIKKFILTTNLHRAPNLEIYDDLRQFVEVLQKTVKKKPAGSSTPVPLPET
jgi:poly-D-alanine transfer protein DltD